MLTWGISLYRHYFYVFPDERVDYIFVAFGFLCFDIQVLESKVCQFILVGLAYVEEYVALKIDITQGHMIGVRHRDVLAIFEVEELCPRFDIQETFGISRDVFYEDVFIFLWGVRTHFQP